MTGASGGIGRALLEHLLGRYHVKALFRSKTAQTDEWQARGCVAVWGDLANEDALAELVAGTRFVFHCAALITGTYTDSYAVNVEGTRRLARAAGRAGCGRFVHVSSVAVYGGGSTDDAANVAGSGDLGVYSQTKMGAERALIEAAGETRLEYTILRPTCVHGPHIKAFTLVPIGLIGKGLPAILGDGTGLMDAVYVDDVISALVLAAESPRAAGEAFNIGNETIALNDFYSHYGRMLNRPVRHLPIGLLRSVAGFLRLLPTTRSRELQRAIGALIGLATNTRRISSAKAAALVGYRPRFSVPMGMLHTEVWAKQEKLVAREASSLESYGPLPFRPLAVVHPATEQEIVDVIALARSRRVKAKAIGSLHSLCPIPETDGICVVLDRYTTCVAINGTLATVQAGMKLRDLNDRLARHGLALPILGAIAEQTVSGAISTATHGGSLHFGTLSDSVEALRIVRADGSVVEVDRSHPSFGAASVSLGLLGVISTVTFRCVPAFALQSRSSVRKADVVLEDFDGVNQRERYLDMLYFAVTDEIEMLAMNTTAAEDADLTADQPRPPMRQSPGFVDSKIGRRLRTVGLKGLASLLLSSASIQQRLTKLSVGRSYQPRTGRSDLVLAFGDHAALRGAPITLLLQGMELAVSYDEARAAITALRNHFRTTRRYPLLPIHIRCSPASDHWLSPSYKRRVCWFEFWVYPHPNSLSKEEIHELLKPFHYRFHWGKETHVDPAYIRPQYDRWEDFSRLRQQWDPAGMFLNEYLESFFPALDRQVGDHS